jgi:hypothetical protein
VTIKTADARTPPRCTTPCNLRTNTATSAPRSQHRVSAETPSTVALPALRASLVVNVTHRWWRRRPRYGPGGIVAEADAAEVADAVLAAVDHEPMQQPATR